MTTVTIHAFAGFRELFGEINQVTVPDGASILSSLQTFAGSDAAIQRELFDGSVLKSHVILMYNRERIDREEADGIPVRDGDEIVLYPPVSGG
jgi:molybdopterin synthase sulfur carrier subunit